MFLATTALSEFWDKEQEILFLGSWCLRQDKPREWESLKYSVMPSPWDDRDRFYEATRYLDECYERMLSQMADYLNAAHQVSCSERYWRILIGPWLLHYLHPAYDRYVHLTEALRRYPGLQTITLDPLCFKVPTDIPQLMDFVLGDAYNLQLFSQLLEGMGYTFPAQTFHNGWPETESVTTATRSRWLRTVNGAGKRGIQLVEGGLSRALGIRSRVGLCDMYLPRTSTWFLACRTAFRAIPIGIRKNWSFTMPSPAFDRTRNDLATLKSTGEFEGLFVQSLPQNFPVLFLEAFALAKSEIRRRYRKIPPVLISLVGWPFNEPFKFLAAESAEEGGRLVAAQHGGGYGVYRAMPLERHESRIGDSFMVWGWAKEKTEPCRNLSSPKLSSLVTGRSPKPAPDKDGPVLLVTTTCPRYLHRFYSAPVGTQWENYFDWELRFLAASEGLRSTILVRLLPFHSYGQAHRQRIAGRFPDVRWDDGQPIYPKLKSSRIVVIDHLSTSFLEALAANVPTVLFWDPHRWEVRDEAEPYFQSLREVGILWDSPEEAAAQVETVYQEPWTWWGDEGLQNVRRNFADRYVFARKDWASSWARALEEEAALSQVRG